MKPIVILIIGALLLLVVLRVVVVLVRRALRPISSAQHFTEIEQDGWYMIDAKPAPGPVVSIWYLAFLLAGLITIVPAVVFEPGRISAGGFLLTWMPLSIALSALIFPLFRKFYLKKRNFQGGPFAVKRGAVRLANGNHVYIPDHYAVGRRNTDTQGLARIAYYVDLDVAGQNYVLAGAMTDNQSMAVYNQVNRRISGE